MLKFTQILFDFSLNLAKYFNAMKLHTSIIVAKYGLTKSRGNDFGKC